MDDDKTVLMSQRARQPIPTPSRGIKLSYKGKDGQLQTSRFVSGFTLGRDTNCEVSLDNERVSRRHAEIYMDGVDWYIRDLDSTNGTYVEGQQVSRTRLLDQCEIQLGITGEPLRIEIDNIGLTQHNDEPESATKFSRRSIESDKETLGGGGTDKIEETFSRTSNNRPSKYGLLLAVVLLLLLVSVGVGIYQYNTIQRLRANATDTFYAMKSIELQLVQQNEKDAEPKTDEKRTDLNALRDQLVKFRSEYERYLELTRPNLPALDEVDRIILRVARVFGECELAMPKDFTKEVKVYIEKWRSNSKFKSAVARGKTYDFLSAARRAMTENGLPLQFYYLGLQESGFQLDAVGPKTKYGIAKGAWQFIPKTAARYGLKTGPLVNQAEYDPLDERHDVYKSTQAAARYLKDIYGTEAQASGLLVMASYNWGEDRINSILRKMPENPRERNFWSLIQDHKIPQETYDYVLRIFSAAVIGENPKLFGMDIPNPLQKS